MRRLKKKYEKPRRPWDKERIEKEKELMKKFGLKRKKELWRAEAILRKYRRIARNLVGKKDEKKEKILIEKLKKMGFLKDGNSIDDVLSLTVENILERRLQTIVFMKGFANSIKHARQLITHGHVKVNGRKIQYPSYLVPIAEEDKIEVG
ncbi:MAG: 30S ribosomal protein S4 [Candidatus Aenigmatarchaeota archaeon]